LALGRVAGLGCGIIYYKTLLAKGLIPEGELGPESLPQCFIDFALRSNAMFPRLAEELKLWGGLDMEFEKTSLLFVMYDDIDVAFAKRCC
jgi:hydrogen cyanide synthase HcnC